MKNKKYIIIKFGIMLVLLMGNEDTARAANNSWNIDEQYSASYGKYHNPYTSIYTNINGNANNNGSKYNQSYTKNLSGSVRPALNLEYQYLLNNNQEEKNIVNQNTKYNNNDSINIEEASSTNSNVGSLGSMDPSLFTLQNAGIAVGSLATLAAVMYSAPKLWNWYNGTLTKSNVSKNTPVTAYDNKTTNTNNKKTRKNKYID